MGQFFHFFLDSLKLPMDQLHSRPEITHLRHQRFELNHPYLLLMRFRRHPAVISSESLAPQTP